MRAFVIMLLSLLCLGCGNNLAMRKRRTTARCAAISSGPA